ncbi:helix-turn-helix domain-containing protein [Nitratireductor sp. CH_MIT9313-5]|uniref:helix-turn-helix domain-containing protein n=1 Tax=Nitratireductor sp. CH_MIT9313-5 TaxID=3107764 RepID=UPI00300BE0B3
MTQIDPYVKTWNENRVDWLYQIARCAEVSPSAVRLGLLFATFLQPDEREEVHPSYKWLVENAHMSRGTIAKALNELEEAGFIRTRRYHAEGTHYSMPFDGNGKWTRDRATPYVPKQMKNPPKGRRKRKTIESKN